MVVAHNLCFSTCVGHLRPPGDGAAEMEKAVADEDLLEALEDRSESSDEGRAQPGGAPAPEAGVTIGRLGVVAHRSDRVSGIALRDAEAAGACFVAPNGAVFAPAARREGVLPRMLREVLVAGGVA